MKKQLLTFIIILIIVGSTFVARASSQEISSEYLSYKASGSGFGPSIQLNNFSTCQAKIELDLYSDIFSYSNVWTGTANYTLYVNDKMLTTYTNPSQTIDISSHIPVTSVKMVSNASTWSVVILTVKVYGEKDPSQAPLVTTPVVYDKKAEATPLTAIMTNSGAKLKWYTSEEGENYSATAPTPSTGQVDTISYWVAEADESGCESKRAKIEVVVLPQPLSYHASFANRNPQPSVVLNNLSTCQKKVVLECYGDIFSTGNVWTGTANYTLYVNEKQIGSYNTQLNIVDVSSHIPVTSVRLSSNASTWSVVDLTVKIYGEDDPSEAPSVTSPVVYTIGTVAIPLTAGLTNTGAALKWYTSEKGDNYSATAPTPSTGSVSTVSYWVAEADESGCESKRAKIDVTVEDILTGFNPSANSSALVIYPNPVQHDFYIENYQQGDNIVIKDITGKTLLTQEITPSMQADRLMSGLYLVEIVRNGNIVQIGKFFKK